MSKTVFVFPVEFLLSLNYVDFPFDTINWYKLEKIFNQMNGFSFQLSDEIS